MSKKDTFSNLSDAYIEFASALCKTSADVYAKTWEETVKFQSAITKSTTDFYKDVPFIKSMYDVYSSAPWKK